jgi:pyruvate kinase
MLPLESTSRLAWRASLDIDAIPSLTEDTNIRKVEQSKSSGRRVPARKTCIVCTIGPASNTPHMILRLREAGMNICRLNMSHGTHAEHRRVIELVRESERKDGMAASQHRPVAIALDTKGPEIRVCRGGGSGVKVEKDQQFTVSFANSVDSPLFDNGCLFLDYDSMGDTVAVGSRIYIDDGNLQLVVTDRVSKGAVRVRALNSHFVKPGKAVNLPYTKVNLPSVSEKDRDDLVFAVKMRLDMVFASFIRKADDIFCIRRILDEAADRDGWAGGKVKIIAKIENYEGVKNIDEILHVSDGIMVARGDLGVELAPEKVFVAQKMLTARAGILGKPVICATQMLESMTTNPRPTRAEATDVANAVLDGADCVMLSAETASGQFPVEAVQLMSAVCLQAEEVIAYQPLFEELRQSQITKNRFDMTETIACSAVNATLHAPSAIAAIVVLSTSGHSARLVAKYRPRVPIIVVTRSAETARSLHLHRGCYPFVYTSCGSTGSTGDTTIGTSTTDSTNTTTATTNTLGWQRDVDTRFYWAIAQAMGHGLVGVGDRVVCIQGSRGGVGHTNTMRILVVPE